MKEYLWEGTINGKRQNIRVFAYNPNDAYNRIRNSHNSASTIKCTLLG